MFSWLYFPSSPFQRPPDFLSTWVLSISYGNGSSRQAGFLLVSFTITSLVPRTVPGLWQAYNDTSRILNEWMVFS